jgi:hypothetical protein
LTITTTSGPAVPASDSTPLREDVLIGAQAIADELGVDLRRLYHMLEKGSLPARKAGGIWVASRSKLRAFFAGEA